MIYFFFSLLILLINTPKVVAQTCSGSYTSIGTAYCEWSNAQGRFFCQNTGTSTSSCRWLNGSCVAQLNSFAYCSMDPLGLSCQAYDDTFITTSGCYVAPGPTNTPAPTPPSCPNGICGAGEDCLNCGSDCGACAPPPTPACSYGPWQARNCGAGTCQPYERQIRRTASPAYAYCPNINDCIPDPTCDPGTPQDLNLQASCPLPGDSMPITWTPIPAASGGEGYSLFINRRGGSNPDALYCFDPGTGDTEYGDRGDYCRYFGNADRDNFTFGPTPGQTYEVELQAHVSGNVVSDTVAPFVCQAQGSVRAVARLVGDGTSGQSCTTIFNDPDGLDGTQFTLSGQGTQTQSGNNRVSWTNIPAGIQAPGGTDISYSLDSIPPAPPADTSYRFRNICLYDRDSGALISSGQTTFSLPGNLRYDAYIGYSLSNNWFQASASDVISCESYNQYIPDTDRSDDQGPFAARRNYFDNFDGSTTRETDEWPVLIAAQTNDTSLTTCSIAGYDCDSSTNVSNGGAMNAQKALSTSMCRRSVYEQVIDGFDLPSLPTLALGAGNTLGRPDDSVPGTYYIPASALSGQPLVLEDLPGPGGDWDNIRQAIIVIVDGDVQINADVKLNRAAAHVPFFALIASGNITVESAIASDQQVTDTTLTNADLEGMYIARGAFDSGLSLAAGNKQLLVKGMVYANSLNLNRRLGTGVAIDTPAELFEFDPMLLFNMPMSMMRLRTFWEELAP